LKLIGSNYYQDYEEIEPKIFGEYEHHYIGRIQSGKIKKLVEHFDALQTLFKIKHYEKIVQTAIEEKKTIPLMIEINIGEEKSKDGLMPDHIRYFLTKLQKHYNESYAPLIGFMTMGSYGIVEEVKRKEFRRFKQITKQNFESFQHLFQKRELSFGMSSDYLLAIEFGATIVRLGTALFGPRQ